MNTEVGTIQKAFQEYHAGNTEDVILMLADAELKDDEYVDAAYILGLCYMRLKDYDNALVYIEQIITSDSPQERIDQCRLLLAYIYSVTGRLKLAEYELKKLEMITESTHAVLFLEAYGAYRQKNFDRALSVYQDILNRNPKNPTALNDYGYILAEARGELPRAFALCMDALRQHPQNPYYLDSVAWISYRMGKTDEALRYIQSAFLLMPGNSELRLHKETIEKAARS